MSIAFNKKFFIRIMRSCLHIAIYILLGLALAFFINSTVNAAEHDDPPPYCIECADISMDECFCPDPPPYDGDSLSSPPSFNGEYPYYGQTTQDNPTGWLLLTSIAFDSTGQRLAGAFFEIRRAAGGELEAVVSTDIWGEIYIELPVGDYYAVNIIAPSGFSVNPINTDFTINSIFRTNVTVWHLPTPTQTQPGRLLITSRAHGTGLLLHGAVFDIRRAIDDLFIAQIATNQFGEAFIDLAEGNYYLREVVAPAGYVHDSSRINVTVHSGSLTEITVWSFPIPEQPPTTTPPPTQSPALGRLLVTSRAHGTGDLLRGAVFEVRRAIDDVFVAQIVSNQFGEASVNLPAGDYFLREITAPLGFIANPNRVSVRIQADRLTEINITNRPVEPETVQTTPENPGNGRLLITNRAQALGSGGREQGTGAVLSNAMFEVRSIMDDRLITQIQTNQFGEAAANLPPGDYYFRQIVPAVGYVLDSARTNIRIVSGELLSVLVISAAETVMEDNANNNETPAYGRLLITLVSSATGERLSGGRITIHDVMTDAHVTTLTTDTFGEASVFLPAGRYFMRQSSMPQGYLSNHDRIPFTVKAEEITDMALAVRAEPTPPPTATPPPAQTQQRQTGSNAPPAVIESAPDITLRNQGRIEIITRAAGSGNPLSGGMYAVYRVSDNRRVGELTTGAGGRTELTVEPGMYFIRELRPTFGFLLETERIFLEVGAGKTVVIELTKVRDLSITDLPHDIDGGFIYITQTGQDMSMLHYVGGGVMLVVAAFCGGLAVWEFIIQKNAKKRASLRRAMRRAQRG